MDKNSSKEFLKSNKSRKFKNNEGASISTNKETKTTHLPSINSKSRTTSRNTNLNIIDRIQEIERIKKANHAKLEQELSLIDQKASLEVKGGFGRRSKYSSHPGER